MRKGLLFSSIVFFGFIGISAMAASLESKTLVSPSNAGKHPDRLGRQVDINPRAYRSPGHRRKLVIAAGDSEALARAIAQGAIQLADYPSFKLLVIEDEALQAAESPKAASSISAADTSPLIVRDDFNVLFLRSGAIDTTAAGSPGTPFGSTVPDSSSVSPPGETNQSRLRLVQFIGPVKRAWLEQLRDIGLELIAYVPNNGYLVSGDVRAHTRLNMLAQSASPVGGFIQWAGPFTDAYKVHPAL